MYCILVQHTLTQESMAELKLGQFLIAKISSDLRFCLFLPFQATNFEKDWLELNDYKESKMVKVKEA